MWFYTHFCLYSYVLSYSVKDNIRYRFLIRVQRYKKILLYDYNFKPNQPIDHNILGPSGIWGNKLKLLPQKIDLITPNSKRPRNSELLSVTFF